MSLVIQEARARSLARAAIAGLALCAVASAAGKVHIVGPGAAYTQIQPAVDAALDGDTVLVKQGNYSAFAIDGKALHVVADAGASVAVQTPVRVENIPAGKVVTLGGLLLRDANPSGSNATGLIARNDAGALRLVDCRIEGSIGSAYPYNGREALRLYQAEDVALVRCFLIGGRGVYSYNGAQGLFARAANVALYDSAAYGGDGADACFSCWGMNGGHGGPGCESPEGLLFSANSHIRGGRGGGGGNENCDIFNPIGPGPGGNGGHGLVLGSQPPSSLMPQAELLGCLLEGGAGGYGGGGFCYFPSAPNGSPGQPLQIHNGNSTSLSGAFRILQSPRVARELTQVPLSITGIPGDEAYLLVSTGTVWSYQSALAGVALVPSAFLARGSRVGAIPASGSLAFTLPLGDLGAGVEARTLFLQALVFDANGAPMLGSFGALAVVDQQF